MYVCMYVCMYVRMYVCRYVCTSTSMYTSSIVCLGVHWVSGFGLTGWGWGFAVGSFVVSVGVHAPVKSSAGFSCEACISTLQ